MRENGILMTFYADNIKYYDNVHLGIAVEDQMFLEMQDFDFAQIQLKLHKSLFPKFHFKIAQILPQILPKKILLGDATAMLHP